MDEQWYKKIQLYSLSDADIRKLVGSVRIISYPDLDKETLQSLFAQQPYVVILFLTDDEKTGHWQCVLKHSNMIELFDPFGTKVDGNRAWLSDAKRQELDQMEPNYQNLFKDYKGELMYNNVKLQDEKINTCGRHIACRLLYNHLQLKDYINIIQQSGLKPDDFVTNLTYHILHK
jgi:hypothetical protein